MAELERGSRCLKAPRGRARRYRVVVPDAPVVATVARVPLPESSPGSDLPAEGWRRSADDALQPLAAPNPDAGSPPSAHAGPVPAAPVVGESRSLPAAAAPTPNPLWAWFTGGNTLTRVGVVILFFGIAFLLRYFAEHFEVPIEVKLAAVGLVGMALIGLGIRLAVPRPGYGLSLQGAGAGVLYLTTYAAFRLYDVLPDAPAIGLLVAISALTVWLAVRSDSQPLAGLAVAGGFVAPMLASTAGPPRRCSAISRCSTERSSRWRGDGRGARSMCSASCSRSCSGRLGPPLLRARALRNRSAVPRPLLRVLRHHRDPGRAARRARREAPVDGLLVFGVPLVGFALQAALVHDTRYGAAWSALAVAVVYAALSLVLRRREGAGFALLARAFLALAAIFATIAVPLAFDERVTAAIWAVEAAGVYWLGVRQRALLARGFALAIQLAAGIVFLYSGTAGEGDRLFANAFFLGAILIALSAFATTYVADRARDELSERERRLIPLLFGWGTAGGSAPAASNPSASSTRDEHARDARLGRRARAPRWHRRGLDWPRLAATASRSCRRWRTSRSAISSGPARRWASGAGWCSRSRGGFTGACFVLPKRCVSRRTPRPAVRPARRDSCAPFMPRPRSRSRCSWRGRRASGSGESRPGTPPGWRVRRHCRPSAILPGDPAIAAAGVVAARRVRRCLRGRRRNAHRRLARDLVRRRQRAVPRRRSPLPYPPLANPLDLALALARLVLFGWARRFAVMSERARYGWLGALTLRRAQWHRAAHRSPLGRHCVATACAAGVETAAG